MGFLTGEGCVSPFSPVQTGANGKNMMCARRHTELIMFNELLSGLPHSAGEGHRAESG